MFSCRECRQMLFSIRQSQLSGVDRAKLQSIIGRCGLNWLILWLVVSVPAALFVGAVISFGNSPPKEPDWIDELGPEMHDQTVVG
jgi:hypothetical protein